MRLSAAALALDAPLTGTDTEFFAVTSECFFEAPARLAEYWPELYRQLSAFYRQDPLQQ